MPEAVRKMRCIQRLFAQGFEKRVRHIARDAADDVGRDTDEIGVVSAAVRRTKEGKAARCRTDGAIIPTVQLRFDEGLVHGHVNPPPSKRKLFR